MGPEEYECKILSLKINDRPVQKIWGERVYSKGLSPVLDAAYSPPDMLGELVNG